jgi:nitrogenase molybdenum-iron protein beta chain
MFRHCRPATANDPRGLSNTGTPLIRIGFPVFDRHHHHRYPVWGYQGAMNVLVWILDKIFDEIDKNTIIPAKTDYSYDIIR